MARRMLSCKVERAHMIKLTNVLVGIDFSDTSESALSYGRELARTFGARLHVLHVVENAFLWVGPDAVGIDFAQLQADLEVSARNLLDGPDHHRRSRSPQSCYSRPLRQLARVRDRAVCQGGKHRSPRRRNAWTRDAGPLADGQCCREGRSHRAMPGAYGASPGA